MNKMILIADDDRNIVELLKSKLHAAGYRVSTAYDGENALRLVKLNKPDLVIMDIMMPNIDGFTLELEVRDDFKAKRLPVIMMTGRPDLKEFFDKTKETKVDAWFFKPFDIDLLANKVQELLQDKSRNS